jgi:hypothetical protein
MIGKGLGMLGKGYAGLAIQRFDGLGYDGLSIVNTTAFLRPVQIVRQFISNLETGNSRYAPYHRFEGLSSTPKKSGEQRRIPTIPMVITNHISGYEGLADMRI